MQIKIKRIKKQDFEEVDMLLKISFEREYAVNMFHKMIETELLIPELTRIARINNQIIGVLISGSAEIKKGKKSIDTISLTMIAVIPAYQNLGIGGELIQNAFDKARSLNYQSVIVMGDEDYYPRFGFKPTTEFNIICPFDISDQNFMAKELFPDALSKHSGTVKYHSIYNDMPHFTI
ncbi:MAG: N-acetyltransferase [Bacteroidales bacterium]|nr:N-acetyltransferase [Bacteroidales bacterium]